MHLSPHAQQRIPPPLPPQGCVQVLSQLHVKAPETAVHSSSLGNAPHLSPSPSHAPRSTQALSLADHKQ